ncbi:MAG: FAD-dependent oxidoreductase [Cyclobacteriaceae bacterium]|nr:FAD-dependent oxidoreductase [Cyclobacteriaceae bacterium]
MLFRRMLIDYLIIGQGLAGSTLATQLLLAGKRVAVIDRHQFPTASSVAAGLINPFTGPKMVKSWKFDELISFGAEYYRNAEQILESDFFREEKIFRPFHSVEQQNEWYGKSTLSGYSPYIHRICDAGEHAPFVHSPFGGLESRAWTLNVPVYLEATNTYLKKHSDFFEESFDENLLEIGREYVRYRDIEAKRIVFCTGHESVHSRFFNWLPLVPVKGELLDIKMAVNFQTIYNRNCFIIPQGGGVFRAGSTYDRKDITMEPTAEGKNQIIAYLRQMTDLPFEIIGHRAGIRPGTMTRRPLIGQHPEISSMFIFNGLGTKGVSLAPYFAREFVTLLEGGNYLHDEVDIKKYYSLYFNSQSVKKSNT